MFALLNRVSAVAGSTLNVGPGYYSTISNALVAATDGDTIAILASTQTECGITITKSVTIQGQGMTNTVLQGATTRSNAADRVFRMNGSAKAVTIKDMTIRYGYCVNSASYGIGGAAIYNNAGTVTVQNCAITMNDSLLTHATYVYGGGALAQQADANCAFTLNNCLVSSNTVAGSFVSPAGGGIWVGHGSLWIEGCSFVGNSAPRHGGAVFGQSLTFLTVRNSTFVANISGANGGALYYPGISGATGTVYNCTICSNSASVGQGINVAGGYMNVYSTILSGNGSEQFRAPNSALMFTNCLINGSGFGTYTGGSNITNQDPRLITLAYNGGMVPTMALQSNSPCKDAGSNVSGLSFDQRGSGYGRARGSGTDIGAFEFGAGAGLTYSGGSFSEKMPQNTGAIDNTNPMLITLSVDTFAGTDGSQITNTVVVSNLPTGLFVSMVRTNSGASAVVRLLGNAAQHASSNTIHNLGFSFQDAAFSLGYASQVGNAARSDLTVEFADPVTNAALSYSTISFQEDAIYNDGRIDNIAPMQVVLTNDIFAGVDGQEVTNHVVVSNLPAGLTVSMVRTNAGSNVVVRLVGQATPHAAVNTIHDLGFAFQDAAFLGGDASVVSGATTNSLSITFLDPATGVAVLYGGMTFTEDPVYNDGRLVATTVGLTLTNDLFNGANGDDFVTSGRVLVYNLPSGLTATVARVDYKHLNLTLSGKALAHNSVNNVNNLTLAFQDSAFYNTMAASVSNATKADLTISFSNPVLTYAGTTFVEYWQNDGTIGNALSLSLVGDAFSGTNGEDLVATGKAVAGNVPGGLNASVVRQSGTQLVFRLPGTATSHTTANNIANLALTFQDSAFAQGGAGAVSNGSRSNLGVQFVGSTGPSNFWVSAASGSDSTGTGSLASPWKTIRYAMANGAVRNDAYDVINVLAGTYNETNMVVTKVIAIQGAGRDTTVVQAGSVYAAAPFDSRVVRLGVSCTLRDMTLQYGNVTNGTTGSAVLCNGVESILERCRIISNVSYGVYTYDGGAISDPNGLLTLQGCEIKDNVAHVGGTAGLYVGNSGSVSISNCQFSGNQSYHGGGGMYAYSPSVVIRDSTFRSNSVALSTGSGGGLMSDLYNGTTVVERCTVTGNQSPNTGGGMHLRGSAVTVIQCTVYGNVAGTNGGGVCVYDGTPRFYNSTIASNRLTAASGVGGGIYNVYGNNVLSSSIVAGNMAAGGGADIGGGATVEDHNLIGNNANSGIIAGQPNANGSYVGTAGSPLDAQLLPPADNGGPTWTCELLRGGPAIDHGSNPLNLATDQRAGKYTRQHGAAVDIGAFEYRPIAGLLFMVE